MASSTRDSKLATSATPDGSSLTDQSKNISPKAEPVTSPSLDREWKTSLIKEVMAFTLFGYCDSKDEPNNAATLAAASKEFNEIKPFNDAFDLEVKATLQHTAKCDYNIHVMTDEKNSPDIEEGTLYLKKKNKREIECQFIKPGTKISTTRIIKQQDLNDNIVNYQIPTTLNHDNVQSLLPNILAIIKKEHCYQPPLKAVWMTRQNHALILAKSTFTEEWCGEEKFNFKTLQFQDTKRKWTKPLSPLQYAAWAGDTPLVNEFLKILPDDLKAAALQQLQDVQNHQLERTHLSAIVELSKEYKEYVAKYDKWDWDQRNDHWLQRISKKQFQSVVNLIQWFCSSTPFDPIPSFKEFPEARSLSLWNNNVLALHSTISFGSSLGLYSTAQLGIAGGPGAGYGIGPAARDFAAISRFCEVRKQDLIKQITDLESDLQKHIVPHHQLAEGKSHRL